MDWMEVMRERFMKFKNREKGPGGKSSQEQEED
jgi:hypothetical protein